MVGYSGTPLPQKLGIKEGHRVALVGAPAGFDLGALPVGAGVQGRLAARGKAAAAAPPSPPLDVIVAFVRKRAELAMTIAACRMQMAQNGGLWIAWPKKTSGVATDLVEDTIREVALPTGLVDNKVCAIDETWSGLRLVIRRELRAVEAKTAKPAAARANSAAAAAKAKPAAARATSAAATAKAKPAPAPRRRG